VKPVAIGAGLGVWSLSGPGNDLSEASVFRIRAGHAAVNGDPEQLELGGGAVQALSHSMGCPVNSAMRSKFLSW
jgi:hypothetical protein